MLALWTRAARNPGTCRCISCISNPSILAKRSSAINTGATWSFGTPTSTFLYTVVFAAGLTIDAKAKRDRNEQWEAAFSTLRGETSQPSADEKGSQETVTLQLCGFTPVHEALPDGVDWDTIYRVSGMELVDDQVFQNRQSRVQLEHISDNLWDLLATDYRFARKASLEWPVNTGRDLVRHYLPPQSLWSPEHMRMKAIRKRQTWKKLAIQELSVGLLVHRLLSIINASQLPQATLKSLLPQLQIVAQLDERQSQRAQRKISKNLAHLQALAVDIPPEEITKARASVTGTGIPQYYQDSDGDFYHISKQMNAAIRNLLRGQETKPISETDAALAITKLCHNLLVSSAAPDLHTFNTLIIGLKKWNYPGLVDAVIAAFDDCKIRPNEITCAAILDHYIQIDRPDHFSRFVANMRGVNNALMLARPDITINERGEERLVRISESKIYQKVYPTPMVFNTLMLGVLQFAGFERALDIYYEMKEDGWGLDVLGLSHFLDDCIQRADWDGGLFIWDEINRIKSKVRASHMTKVYTQMLGLCTVTMKTSAYNRILSEVVERGFDSKRILGSAMKMARAAENKKRSEAPAWTADNLLIAVSGYMKDGTSAEGNNSTLLEEADPFKPPAENKTLEIEQPVMKDPDEAWSAWMEHELGETMSKEPKS